jgi:hypothetical protein
MIIVTDRKGLSQPACPREWKKYEEGDEEFYKCDVDMCVCVYMMYRRAAMLFTCTLVLNCQVGKGGFARETCET